MGDIACVCMALSSIVTWLSSLYYRFGGPFDVLRDLDKDQLIKKLESSL